MFERFFSRNKKQARMPEKMLQKMPPPMRQKKKILIKRRYLLDNKGDRAMLLEELPMIETKMRKPIQKHSPPAEKLFTPKKPNKENKESREKRENTFDKVLDENKLLQQIIGYQKKKNLELESILEAIGDNKKNTPEKKQPIKKEQQDNKEDEAMEINFYMVSTNEELEKKLKVRRAEGNVILNVNDVHIVINNKSKNHFPVVGWA